MGENIKKLVKRWLKKKVTINLGMMVIFMITGGITYSYDGLIYDDVFITEIDGKTIARIGEQKIEIEYPFTNNGTIKNFSEDSLTGNGVLIETNTNFNLTNNGIIYGNTSYYEYWLVLGSAGNGIKNNGTIENITNRGIIFGNIGNSGSFYYNSGNGIDNRDGILDKLTNNGVIYGSTTNKIYETSMHTANGISNYSGMIGDIINNGVILGVNHSDMDDCHSGNGIENNGTIENIINSGIIYGNGTSSHEHGNGKIGNSVGNGIYNNQEINNLVNYGVIAGSNKAIFDEKTLNQNNLNQNNYGLLINGSGTDNVEVSAGIGGEINIGTTEEDNRFIINTVEKNDGYVKLESEQSLDLEKINSKLGENDNYKVSENSFKNLILNGYGTTLSIDGSLTLDNTIINGGVDKEYSEEEYTLINQSATIKGNDNTDSLTLTGNSIVNGNIDLSGGDDNLIISDSVQINGNLDGGKFDNDMLNFISSDNQDGNINLYYKVEGFENINVATDVTLFESAVVTDAENITIQKNGNLILRIDGTNNNSHSLSENIGTISSEGGKLLLALNKVDEGEIINFGDTKLDESMKGNEIGYSSDITIDTTSLLHNVKKESENSVIVTTVENLPINPTIPTDLKYEKLNLIYQSMRETNQVKEFNVTDDRQLSAFTSYLHDIYANNPYSFSATLSRKSISMFSEVVMSRDLHPEVNKWTIYSGLTHIDGKIKDTYYGKGYYTYDIGSKDISVDSKITGMYVQGEYGVDKTLNLGVIFGGNQAKSEINNNSKVEGDSFYLGAYTKKFLGNLRLLAGVGYQYGNYEADRVAIGYEGITTTRTFDSNYNDNTFNIYAQTKYSNKLVNNLYLEPSVALDYTYINQDGASEDGVLAIETEDKVFSYTTAKFGVDLRKDIPTTSATHLLLAGIYYNRILEGYDGENIAGRFKGGNNFDILVSPSNKHELGLRAKYEVTLDSGVTFDIKGSYTFERESYNKENKNTYNREWTVGAGIGYKF